MVHIVNRHICCPLKHTSIPDAFLLTPVQHRHLPVCTQRCWRSLCLSISNFCSTTCESGMHASLQLQLTTQPLQHTKQRPADVDCLEAAVNMHQ
jgi:hypothetical protein